MLVLYLVHIDRSNLILINIILIYLSGLVDIFIKSFHACSLLDKYGKAVPKASIDLTPIIPSLCNVKLRSSFHTFSLSFICGNISIKKFAAHSLTFLSSSVNNLLIHPKLYFYLMSP